jgi:hypothetical protein
LVITGGFVGGVVVDQLGAKQLHHGGTSGLAFFFQAKAFIGRYLKIPLPDFCQTS